jgi:hypothetical protein
LLTELLKTEPADSIQDEPGVRLTLRNIADCERLIWQAAPDADDWASAVAEVAASSDVRVSLLVLVRSRLLRLVRDYDARHNADRKGPWFPVSVSGRRFWPLDPRPQDFDIEDIAWSASNIPRFNGHGRVFVSVAQHSVLVSQKVRPENAILGLLHDAAEPFFNDVMSPVKVLLGEVYAHLEWRCWLAIAKAFGVPHATADTSEGEAAWDDLKEADRRALVTEHRLLFPGGYLPLETPVRPYADPVEPWSPEHARERFLARFRELCG